MAGVPGASPDGCQYSAFCRDYDAWRGGQDALMGFEHAPGDNLFVDYAGLTMSISAPTSVRSTTSVA